MLTDELQQFLAVRCFLHQVNLHHIHVAEVVEGVVGVVNVCHATAHTCSKVASRLTQDNDTTACHVLATMVAGTLHNSDSARVADCKTLAYLAVHIQFSAGGSV